MIPFINYINYQIVDEGNLLFTEIFQLIRGGNTVLEFHHFLTPNELVDLIIEYR